MTSIMEVLDGWSTFDFDSFIQSRTSNDVTNSIRQNIGEEEFLTLLSPTSDSYIEDIATLASDITTREFGRTIQLYTPLYLSSYCKNRCIYCGFNEDNKIHRSRLNLEEIHRESERLSKLGVKHILLLTGGDRVNTPLSYIEEAVKVAKIYFDSISIEVYGMNQREYNSLINLGVDNVTIYQETYDRELYSKVHLSGEKSSYDFRLEAPERAAKAGARSVNLGALLGLGDPVKDFFMAALHTKLIRDRYPGCDVALSYPRLREALNSVISSKEVPDRLLVKMILAYRLYVPRGGISISTRESEDFRNNILPLGVTKMSAQSKTSVGESDKEQFKISDGRTVKELDRDLRKRGYQPVYKDWVII